MNRNEWNKFNSIKLETTESSGKGIEAGRITKEEARKRVFRALSAHINKCKDSPTKTLAQNIAIGYQD